MAFQPSVSIRLRAAADSGYESRPRSTLVARGSCRRMANRCAPERTLATLDDIGTMMNMNRTAWVLSFVSLVLGITACERGPDGRSGRSADMTEAPTYSEIEIIAHRGDSWFTPENTMASVTSAWRKDADAVEVDVYLTRDDRVVVLHDRTTGRTGDMDLPVNDATAEELRRVDVGSWKGEEFAGEPIPYLEDVVASIPSGDKRLFIEIKGTGEAIPAIERIVAESGKRDRIVIIGFELDTVREAKATMPDVPVYWLLSAPRDDDSEPRTRSSELVATAKENDLDGLSVDYRGISRELVEACRNLGMGIYVWTVNDIADLTAMADLRVDGITTDRIDNARTVLRQVE